MIDSLVKEVISFNSVDILVVKALNTNRFSFCPLVDIQGMNLDEETEFWEAYDKFEIDTNSLNLELYSDPMKSPLLEGDLDIVKHYNDILKEAGISYSAESAGTNKSLYVVFSDISKFSII